MPMRFLIDGIIYRVGYMFAMGPNFDITNLGRGGSFCMLNMRVNSHNIPLEYDFLKSLLMIVLS